MVNWVRGAIGLATFGFINLVLFLVLNSPMEQIFGIVGNYSTQFGVASPMAPILSMLRVVFGLTFVLSMIGLIVWFFLGAHQEEYEQY